MTSKAKREHVHTVYLPEYRDVEQIAVAESVRRGKPVRTGSIIREAIQGFVARWNKRNSQG